MADATEIAPIDFQTHPSRYRHWDLEVDGERATLKMHVKEEQPLNPGYVLKLNSYDLGVDIELADAYQRLRFEHPEVKVVTVIGALDRIFCAGANIGMLGSVDAPDSKSTSASTPTRRGSTSRTLPRTSGLKTYIVCAERRLFGRRLRARRWPCEEHPTSSTTATVRRGASPRLPYLGVLPGHRRTSLASTDKRKVRRDRDGRIHPPWQRGSRASGPSKWGLVDGTSPHLTKF